MSRLLKWCCKATFRCNAPVPSSSQPLWELVNIGFQSGYIALWHQCLCGSHSIQSDTDLLLHPPSDSLKCFPSVSTKFPNSEGPFRHGNLSWFSSPTPGCRPSPSFLLSLHLLLFHILLSYAWIHIVLSNDQGLPVVFSQCSENCSICGCTPDAFMQRDALHVHPFLNHLGMLWTIFSLFSDTPTSQFKFWRKI